MRIFKVMNYHRINKNRLFRLYSKTNNKNYNNKMIKYSLHKIK